MAILVSAHQLSKTFASRPLFTNITFMIESGDRVGLIGPNGAGKSTLLKILSGKTTPDSGTVSTPKGLRIGFLEQTPHFLPQATVQSTILESFNDPEDWENIVLAEEIAAKFSLNTNGIDLSTPVSLLSGGWKKRVALARELAKKPDFLLLDEPTNHLDIESILWLEDFLSRSNFATLTITHDRLFLQRIANRILELDRRNEGGLLSIKGDYATYLETKDQLMAAQEHREIVLKNTLRRETEWLRRGAKARTTKQQARITRAANLKDEVSELNSRNQYRTARIEFQNNERNPKRLIEATDISKSYGNRLLFKNISLTISPGTRIGLLGPNGCGKSTFIRTLVGVENADTGSIFRADGLTVAYFEQNRETLDPSETLANTLCPRGDFVEFRNSRVHIRSYLDRFLFTPEQMDMKIGNLSGGEQSRVLLAKLMLQPANILVLDEPTNDLDMATLAVLEECLTDFNGAVFLVTHDRYFLDQVANKILAFDLTQKSKGNLVSLVGLEQWEDWHESQQELIKEELKKINAVTNKISTHDTQNISHSIAQTPQTKRKLSYKEQRELDSIEADILIAEETLQKLTDESAKPEYATNSKKLAEITKELSAAHHEVERLYKRWQELSQ